MKREKEDKKGAKHECWKTDGRETKCKKKLNEANSNDMKTESEKREREREREQLIRKRIRKGGKNEDDRVWMQTLVEYSSCKNQ